MDLGTMLAEALERHGFAPPSGSGVAASGLRQAAEDFLEAVRRAGSAGEGARERELRDAWARLDAETADGELSADDVAAKVRRKAEVEAEMGRLGIAPDARRPATYYEAGSTPEA